MDFVAGGVGGGGGAEMKRTIEGLCLEWINVCVCICRVCMCVCDAVARGVCGNKCTPLPFVLESAVVVVVVVGGKGS